MKVSGIICVAVWMIYACNILISFCGSQEKIKPTFNIFITKNSFIKAGSQIKVTKN